MESMVFVSRHSSSHTNTHEDAAVVLVILCDVFDAGQWTGHVPGTDHGTAENSQHDDNRHSAGE